MQTVRLAPTETTPEVVFDPERNRLELHGHCQPQRCELLFKPLLLLLRRHFSQRQPQFFTVHLVLDYIDKATVVALRELFVMLDAEGRAGRWIEVIWSCPAEDPARAQLAHLLMNGLPNIEFHCQDLVPS